MKSISYPCVLSTRLVHRANDQHGQVTEYFDDAIVGPVDLRTVRARYQGICHREGCSAIHWIVNQHLEVNALDPSCYGVNFGLAN